MSTKNIRTGKCAVCERWITLKADGTFRQHGPHTAPCLGIYHTPEASARLVLPPLTTAQLEMIRLCWRIGDWRPIEREFGIKCQHYEVRGNTCEDELAEVVAYARRWIERLIELSRSRGTQNLGVRTQ